MLIKCPECETPISSKAAACPHCGYPLGSDENIQYVPVYKKPIYYHPEVQNSQPEDVSREDSNEKSSNGIISLTIAALLGLAYLAYSIVYWRGVNSNALQDVAKDSWEALGAQLGAGIATQMVTPHLICTGMAAFFNVVAEFSRIKWFALTAGITYALAIAVFPMYFIFVIGESVLCFIAFARMMQK